VIKTIKFFFEEREDGKKGERGGDDLVILFLDFKPTCPLTSVVFVGNIKI